jgi:hypothetical protein
LKTFEVRTPDGRSIRRRASDVEALRASLVPGYVVAGEVFGANIQDDAGGYVVPIGGKSLLAVLLESHGDELRGWLDLNGYEPTLRP